MSWGVLLRSAGDPGGEPKGVRHGTQEGGAEGGNCPKRQASRHGLNGDAPAPRLGPLGSSIRASRVLFASYVSFRNTQQTSRREILPS
jgi:hypothetical protein